MDQKREILLLAQMFEFYVRTIWPIHRVFVRKKYTQRCKICAASSKMYAIGSDGVCSACHQYKDRKDSPEQASSHVNDVHDLNQILQTYQGTGKGQYDALILFSGGKDSAYMIKRLQTECPNLRILAFTIDNNFMSPIVKENIEKIIGLLNVDHIYVRPPKSFYTKLFTYTLTHLNDKGGYGTVDFSDGEFLLDTARCLASEKNIPLILAGYSKYQVQDGLNLFHFESPSEFEHMDRTHVAGIDLDNIFTNRADRARWWRPSTLPQGATVARLIFPLYAWDLEEDVIKKQVQDWGLISKKSVSPIVTNHQLIPLIGVTDVHKLGFSSFEWEFTRMIREGRADRRHWQKVFEFLEYTSRTGFFVKKPILKLCSDLGLTLDQLGIKFK